VEHKPKILIVDDEVNILNALRRLLRREGYELHLANSGEEGLEILNKIQVDLIISDQRMPGMSGVEFLEKAKDICPLAIRIILSGYTDLKSITEAINRGYIYKFILKPWEDEELKAAIRESLTVAHLQQENKRLTDELNKQNEELKWLNENLENKVKQRTRDLELRNQALEKFQYILHQIPLGIVGIGDDGRIAFVNRWIKDHFNNANDFLEKSLEDALGEDISAVLSEVLRSGELYVREYKIPDTSHKVELRGTKINYPNGAYGFLIIFVDR